MTVRQLRKLLEGLPDDTDVVIDRNQTISPCMSIQAMFHQALKRVGHVLVSNEGKTTALHGRGWRMSAGGTVFNDELNLVMLDGLDADRGRRFTKARMRTLTRAKTNRRAP